MLLFWILVGCHVCSAFDLNDDQAFKKTISFNWRHYDPIGYASFNLRTDNQLEIVKSVGAGHYFDLIDAGLHVTANRQMEDEPWKIGYRLHKKLFNVWNLTFSYQPITNSKFYGLSGYLTDSLFINLGYSSLRDNLYLGGRWRLTDSVRWYMRGTESQDEWTATTGLNVSFYTGKRATRKAKLREKETEWLN